ncbi:NADP-specific glutamate dehydrogenase [Paracoccus sp. (in: a-proteobacteria)]|uniref:NADP-specific glutamate dehydrogenase n=1 Tax=Paracoccus sp. TaxID=267 RepID=UPI0026E0B1D5|nr:NADP-specific glutamate dehydrogenase [Paracoccus sp. (in: a-proteobacteria)]MDO5647749.1 NADP-specific glutamate dehydrogenase [Paracoccus sp. (in: a-proteobacteria)]
MTKDLTAITDAIIARNPGEDDFHQALRQVLASLQPLVKKHPDYLDHALIQRICEPERQIIFRVPWVDDDHQVQVNRGFRVQYSSALGPYKGGLRFDPGLTLGTVKFLGFEQMFKNALTGLPIGAGKGGADFDPHGRSEDEVMRFCQSFITEMWRHLGDDIDIPAGDKGVGEREVGFMFGHYRRLTNRSENGVITGKALTLGGLRGRAEATGYGTVFFLQRMLETHNDNLDGKTCIVSGAGDVSIYAIEKIRDAGGVVRACSDSGGFVQDDDGIDVELLKQVKQDQGESLAAYAKTRKNARFHKDKTPWGVACDIAIPAATENELDAADAARLIKNGVNIVAEGANMPCTADATDAFRKAGVLFAPAKAANAGGVAASVLEMQQNATLDDWDRDRTNRHLQRIMTDLHDTCTSTAAEYGNGDDYMLGANIAGFQRVARAMRAMGVV